jgi:hypothetical protein
MARRQDRKVIKLEGSYGSDRQTFIVKRNYDLRVCDVQEDAARLFKIPMDQLVLYWKVKTSDVSFVQRSSVVFPVFRLKGRCICDTPNELLETLGIENNHQMRVCREDDPVQQNRRRELRSLQPANLAYSSSSDVYRQQVAYPQYQQQA